jgi:hypothetical protein
VGGAGAYRIISGAFSPAPDRRKKMTKDEMKDRISLALKDPVLQQGFEIICKENAELKEEVKNNEDLATVAYMQGAESQKKKSEKKLTKAKEIEKERARILRNLLRYFGGNK